MGRSTGLEPATLGTTNRCSNQLSYDRRQNGRPYGRALAASRDLPVRRRKTSSLRHRGSVSGQNRPSIASSIPVSV